MRSSESTSKSGKQAPKLRSPGTQAPKSRSPGTQAPSPAFVRSTNRLFTNMPTQGNKDRFHSRGYLPHVSARKSIQFITFRLADSMPQSKLVEWKAELDSGKITDSDLRKRIEQYLDSGYGSCALGKRQIADIVRQTLIKWDGERYRLIAWVIMPNHVHILIELIGEHSLSDVMHSIKSYTAHAANKVLGSKGRFWSVESFDRYIRDGRHLASVVKYIEENPVKAGLSRDVGDWEYGSAYIEKG